MMASKASAALLFKLLLLCCCRVEVSLCIKHPSDAERFSSSIVATDNNEMLFGGLQISPNNNNQRRRGDYNNNDVINHSYIDRDPIYFTADADDDIGIIDDSNLHTTENDPLARLYNRHHPQAEQWQSPLEQISPLSLSSPYSIKSQSESPSIYSGSPLIINNGPKHSHTIDVQTNPDHHQQQQQYKLKTRSTGTTIAAVLSNNSKVLILAADTRATDDTTVADKRCEKLHALAKNVWCAGAGTSADVDAMVRRVKFTFWKRGVLNECNVGIGNMGSSSSSSSGTRTQLLSSSEDNDVPVASVMAILHYLRTQLQKTRGALGVNLLVGGYEYALNRAYLAAVHPHGSMDVVTYAALGSGGLAATGVLESRYPQIGCSQCTVEDGIRLAVDAVKAGIDNDLGSGSQVDVCVISAEGVMYRRAIVKEEELEWINDNDSWYDSSRRGKENGHLDVATSGVNGFGNQAFSIQSKKIVVDGRIAAERKRREWLNEVLRSE
jgi:20S proteasome subunit beta 2